MKFNLTSPVFTQLRPEPSGISFVLVYLLLRGMSLKPRNDDILWLSFEKVGEEERENNIKQVAACHHIVCARNAPRLVNNPP